MKFDLIAYLEKMNDFLEISFIFRGFKFMVGFYLLLMVFTMILMLVELVRYEYWKVLVTGSEQPSVKGKMQEAWERSTKRLESEDPDNWKAAILELSEMLNEVLGIIGYDGALLGEKLEHIVGAQVGNKKEIEAANQVKNIIIQDSEFVLTKEEAERTAKAFEKTLRFLEAID